MVLFGIVVILVCMQNWKEKASELGQWDIKGVPILYPILFITLLIPILFWNVENIRCFDDFTIADNSARYLLSALVQSLAAIIAIVVTMTLVAVQLTASAYSPRVIDIFKKDWVMWLLLVWYGLSIFFGLFVLEMIGGEYQNLSRWGISLEFCVFFAYSMGIIAFVGLFWHIGNVITLLKPETIIKRLSIKITKDKILNSKKYPEKDPIQPIMDIIHSSIMKYDIATTRSGLKVVTNRVAEITVSDVKNIDSNMESDISRCFCDHFERVGRLTVIKMDEESTEEVISRLGIFLFFIAEKGLEDAASQTARSLGYVGRIATEKGFEGAAGMAARSLDEYTTHTYIGIRDTEKRVEHPAAFAVIESLVHIGITAAEKGFEDATRQVADSLGYIGRSAAEKRIEQVAKQAAESLGCVGGIAAKNGFEDATQQVAWSLQDVGKSAAERGLEDAVGQTTWSLVYVGISATENRLEEVAEQAAWSLAELTILSEELVKTAIQRLEQEEQDRDALRKFMNIYEQQLKELRTRNPN